MANKEANALHKLYIYKEKNEHEPIKLRAVKNNGASPSHFLDLV